MSPKKTSEIFNALKTELGMDHFSEILANMSLNLSEDGKSLFDVERRESMTGTKMRFPLGWFFERIQDEFEQAKQGNSTEYAQLLEPAVQIIKNRIKG